MTGRLPRKPKVFYVRADGLHTLSVAQQLAMLEQRFGPVPPERQFMDLGPTANGMTFDRPEFKAMLEFCEKRPQPKHAVGTVCVYEITTFGTPRKPDGSPDLRAFIAQQERLALAGWDLDTVKHEVLEGDAAEHQAMEETEAYLRERGHLK
jgi:hypothetical protein